MNSYDIIVIGAGASGLIAAGRAAELGAKVLVLEKMRQEGRKLLITGKGRCNITNNAEREDFITQVHPNGKFLRSAFALFYSPDIIELLEKNGLEINLERGGRYFPATNKAADVVQTILKWVTGLGVEVRCNYRVEKLFILDSKITGLRANGEDFTSDKIILASGGRTYPATGSNGDGYELARKAGHKVTKIRPSLVPFDTVEKIPGNLHKMTLKNVRATVWTDNKKTDEAFGEVMFMDFGLSGPIILTMSRKIVESLDHNKKVEISIDLKPALDDQKLDNRLQRDINDNGKQTLGSVIKKWLPLDLIPFFIEKIEINPDKECHQISSKERKKIHNLMKNMRFTISRNRSFKEAIITAGGVSTKEISPKTMESKLISGLYFAGEIIDLDANTGGYNLQIAWSTGWVAGEAAANNCKLSIVN